MSSRDQICFERQQFNVYVIVIVLVSGLLFVIYTESQKPKEKFTSFNASAGLNNAALLKRITKSETDLNRCNLDLQYCKSDLAKESTRAKNCQVLEQSVYTQSVKPNGPVRDYNRSDDYQQVGFLYNNTGRFPLYGRRRFKGRGDRWEYYAIDDSRNQLRIEVPRRNFEEINNDDTLSVPALSQDTLSAQVYAYDNFRYTG